MMASLQSVTTSSSANYHYSKTSHHHKKEDSNRQGADDDLAFCVVWSPLPPITWLIPVIGHLGICDSRGVASDFQGPYFVGDNGKMLFGAPTRAVCFGPPATAAAVSPTGVTLVQAELEGHNNYNRRVLGETGEGDQEDDTNNNCYASLWDRSIQEANEVYRGRMHNIFCDNCHSHVANALNRMSAKLTSSSSSSLSSTSGATAKKNKLNCVTNHGFRCGSSAATVTMTSKWDMIKLAFLVFFKGRFLSWSAIFVQFGPFLVLVVVILATTTFRK